MTTRRDVLALAAMSMAAGAVRPAKSAAPAGQLTVGVHITLAPTWLDQAETAGIITPFMVMYALHDAMVKPMPGQIRRPAWRRTWSATEDGLSWRFPCCAKVSNSTTASPSPPRTSSSRSSVIAVRRIV